MRRSFMREFSATVVVGWAILLECTSVKAVPPKAILSIFIDDLGFYDTSVYNPDAPTPHLQELSHEQGMILHRHYVYKYCSPTRRAFLSGRFPVHMTGMQAPTCSNWLPLDYTLLSQKLKAAPGSTWRNHFVGKGHLGYQTMDHLPINRGFDSHVGYLGGAEEYVYGDNYFGQPGHDCPGKPAHCIKDFWYNGEPAPPNVIDQVFYSTNYYTTTATQIISSHNMSESLWLHLTYQGVHAPYVEPPVWEQIPNETGFWDQTFGSMLKVVDTGIKNVTEALHASGLWEDTLVLISSDNGGIGPGNNFPLRGMKATPWEGGTRVMAFLTGGYLPASFRGTSTNAFISVADWYPTFCTLAGVADCSDNIIRGNASLPIDGVNVWPRITNASSAIGHEFLPTTENGIIYAEQWKYLSGAPATNWYTKNDTHIADNRTAWPCQSDGRMHTVAAPAASCYVCTKAQPCLFDVVNDPAERVNLAATHKDIVTMLAAKLEGFSVPQANASIDSAILARDYDCVKDITAWWGNFSGPCCKRKTGVHP
eukprot:m.249525 g.249525  ORF g.249525 m.249525 type:complete len:537 (+) comp19525_c0_seq2:91-1701(+)